MVGEFPLGPVEDSPHRQDSGRSGVEGRRGVLDRLETPKGVNLLLLVQGTVLLGDR